MNYIIKYRKVNLQIFKAAEERKLHPDEEKVLLTQIYPNDAKMYLMLLQTFLPNVE